MDDSFQPLGVAVPLLNMLLGEIIYGGLGGGLYGMIFVALIALFIGGLMIGRTPDHLGKQIGPPEMKIVALYTLVAPVTMLSLTAIAVVTKPGLAGLTTNTGAHGFTEILFAYASCFANNGQTMASLNANNLFYNMTTIVAMLAGRYALAILALALAGRFASMSRRPPGPGTMPRTRLRLAFYLPEPRCCSARSVISLLFHSVRSSNISRYINGSADDLNLRIGAGLSEMQEGGNRVELPHERGRTA